MMPRIAGRGWGMGRGAGRASRQHASYLDQCVRVSSRGSVFIIARDKIAEFAYLTVKELG